MTTSPNNSFTDEVGTSRGGLGFWKVLGIIAVVLIAIAVIGPLLKGLFWIAFIALAGYGAYMIFRSRRESKSGGSSLF